MQNDGLNSYSSSEKPANPGEGCLGELTWLCMGLTLPIVNRNFYRKASNRKVISALLVFFVFAFFLTVLTTINFYNTLAEGRQGIQKAFDEGTFPTITIQDGIATIDAPQPFYLLDEDGQLIVLDTTGQITDIDKAVYYQGFLLTRTELIMLNKGKIETISLADLQTAFEQNPIVLDRTSSVSIWKSISNVMVVIGFFAVAIWNMLLRLGYLALLALLIWPLARLFNPSIDYQSVFGIGAYVLIPAMILHYVIVRSMGSGFIFLQTLLFVPLWLVGLFWAFRSTSKTATIRSWEMLLPLPLLALIAVDKINQIPDGDILLWGALALTLLAAVAVARLWPAQDPTITGMQPPIDPVS
jgi:hypothetical protein